jgi:hypothetical protein
MIDETPGSAADESQGPELDPDGAFVLATYREIAARFRLGGPGAARTKARRAKWAVMPRRDHPADPLRIQVPREAWDRAAEICHRAIRSKSGHEAISRGRTSPSHNKEILHLRALVALLREQVERERQIADEARAGRAAAERRAVRAEDDLRAERNEFRRREEELPRLATLLPPGTKLPDLPSIRQGLAELAAEFTTSSTTELPTGNPANLPSILEGLSELASEFSASPPEQPGPSEALPRALESPERSSTKPTRVDELPSEGAVQCAMAREAEGSVESSAGVLSIELDQATVTTRTGAELVEEASMPEPSIASSLQQDQAPMVGAKSRTRWLRFRRLGAS